MYVCAALIAASSIVSSCKKDDPKDSGNNPTPAEIKCYVTKTKLDNVNHQQYVYNANNRLERINTYAHDGTTIGEHTKITYDGSGRATRIEDYEDTDMTSYTTVEYNSNNMPTKARIYSYQDSTGTMGEVAQLTNVYNGNQVTRTNIYFVSNGVPMLFAYQEYTYANGNIVTEKSYFADEFGKGELTSTTTYTYDNKKNPYMVLNLPIIYGVTAMSNNNVTQSSSLSAMTGSTTTENITYQYNGTGYPTSAVSTTSEGTTTTDMEYNCK